MKKEYDFSKGKRGTILPADSRTTKLTIRLDKDVVDWYVDRIESAGGGNFQTLMNQALREFMKRAQDSSMQNSELLRRAG